MRKALVTGAAGFIGGGLVRRLLAEGWEVHALLGRSCLREALAEVEDRITVHLHDGSMAGMTAILEAARPDVVFHLASLFLSEHRPDQVGELIGSNLLFSTQLAEAMSLSGAKNLVNTGTSWQHFGTEDYRPVNLYAATKQAFEDLLAYYHDARGLSVITLKLYDTYGPGDRRPKLINLLLDAARTGRPLAMSPGGQTVVLTHLDDVTAAFAAAAQRLLAAEAPLREDFLVSGDRLTLRELAARVAEATGRPLNIEWGGRPYRDREVMAPVASEGRLLPGWTPGITLEEGLQACFRLRGA